MKITIAGEAGSGKGGLRKKLSNFFNYEQWSMGDMRREIAQRHGLTIDQFNKIGEKEDWTDREVDDFQKYELGKRENLIVEGRLSWFMIPNTYKIFLDVDPKEGARRIYENQRKSEKPSNSLIEMMGYTEKRRFSDIKRYEDYYGVNPYKKEYFDFVLDTTNLTPEKTFENIINNLLIKDE